MGKPPTIIPEAPPQEGDEVILRESPLGSIGFKEALPRLHCRDCRKPIDGIYVEVTVSQTNHAFPYGVENVAYQLCLEHGSPLILESIFPA